MSIVNSVATAWFTARPHGVGYDEGREARRDLGGIAGRREHLRSSVGYGLEELEILEYVIGKARLMAEPGETAIRHFLLQGFFSHEEELARSLSDYYAECGIELIPFLRDQKDWDQLIDVLEEYARIAPAGAPLNVQILKEMEALLNE
jgi:hypothetical protein